MNKFCRFCFLFLTICGLTGCTSQSYDVYLFRYDKYFNIFPNKKQTFIEANRFFHKSHNNVRYIKIQKFSDLQREYEVVKTRAKNNGSNRNTVFFLDNLCFNAYMATSNHPDRTNFKFITYNYEEIRKDRYQKYSTINFVLDFDLIYNTILDQIKLLSKKEDYGDVAYLYGANFAITTKVADRLRKECSALYVSNVTGSQSLKNWINNNKVKYGVMVIFAMEYNQGMMGLEKSKLDGTKIIEVFSNFGSEYDYINRSILIDDVNIVQHCLHSKYIKQYLAQTDGKSQTSQAEAKSQSTGKQKKQSGKKQTTTTTVKKQSGKKQTTTTTVKKQSGKKQTTTTTVKKQPNKKQTTTTTVKKQSDKKNETKKKTKTQPQQIEILSSGVTNIPLTNKNCLSVVVHKPQKEHYSLKLEQKILENNKKKKELEDKGLKEKNIFQKALDLVKKVLPQKPRKQEDK